MSKGRKKYHTETPVLDFLLIMTYILYPFIFYPIFVKEHVPVVLGLIGWMFAFVFTPAFGLMKFIEWSGTWTF